MCDWCPYATVVKSWQFVLIEQWVYWVTSGMKEFKAHISMLLIQSHQSLREQPPGESLHKHFIVVFCPLQENLSSIQSHSIATYHLDLLGGCGPSTNGRKYDLDRFPVCYIETSHNSEHWYSHVRTAQLMCRSLSCGRKPERSYSDSTKKKHWVRELHPQTSKWPRFPILKV